jgi:protein SCO1/2
MPTMPTDLSRRRTLTGVFAACATAAVAPLGSRARAENPNADHGRVIPPVPIPDLRVADAEGQTVGLSRLLQGRATALHLMFTGCSSVCPIQGVIFERVQTLLPDQHALGIQLLSLSIDPLADRPAALKAWLQRYNARDGWTALAPRAADLAQVLALFGQGPNAVENHVTQVNIIDRRGQLVFRTLSLPSGDSIASILRKV